MNGLVLLQLSITLLQGVLKGINEQPNSVSSVAANEIQAALDALIRVSGTPVTYQQLEQLRAKPEW